MDRGRTQVVPGEQPVVTDLPLDTEVPLLSVRVLDRFRIQGITASYRKGGFRRSGRERISSGNVEPWIVKASDRTIECRAAGIGSVNQDGTGLLGIRKLVENSICASDRHPTIALGIPCQTHSRSPLVPDVVADLEPR